MPVRRQEGLDLSLQIGIARAGASHEQGSLLRWEVEGTGEQLPNVVPAGGATSDAFVLRRHVSFSLPTPEARVGAGVTSTASREVGER